MPHLLQHTQLDKAAWDACIASSEQRQVYALSWYLDVVSPGWQAVVEKEGDKYVAVMPLPVRNKYGIAYLQQPLFCQQLGIYSRKQLTPEKAAGMLAVVGDNFSYVSGYAFCTANTSALQQTELDTACTDLLYTHYLPLHQTYEQLWKGYHRDRKYNLNKARREKTRIIQSQDVEPLIQLFRQNIAKKVYGGVSAEAYQMLRRLFTATVEKGVCELLYTVAEDGGITAGGMFLYYGGHITYIFNAADSNGRRHNGRTLILDEVIRRNAGTQLVLDFESPMIESIADFYQSFGSTPVPFYEWRYNRLPLPIRIVKQVRQQVLLRFLKP